MAETTVEELYQARINDLQRLHKDALELRDIQFQELKERANGRETELKAQADGLLGAIGRINTENAELKAKLQDEREKSAQICRDTEMRMLQGQVESERLQDENKRLKNELDVMREELVQARKNK